VVVVGSVLEVVVVAGDPDPEQAAITIDATSPARDLIGSSQQIVTILTVSLDLR
jgi:hypothetical protein